MLYQQKLNINYVVSYYIHYCEIKYLTYFIKYHPFVIYMYSNFGCGEVYNLHIDNFYDGM